MSKQKLLQKRYIKIQNQKEELKVLNEQICKLKISAINRNEYIELLESQNMDLTEAMHKETQKRVTAENVIKTTALLTVMGVVVFLVILLS